MAGNVAMPGIDVIVFSRTLPPSSAKGVRVTNEDPAAVIAAIKKQKGSDIWLFGGGELCRSLIDAGVVDTVEIAVMPVLLGAGIPLLPPGDSVRLVLSDVKKLPASGIVVLAYSVEGAKSRPPRVRYVKSSRAKA
jgi:dihydrofolate reductase